jgi:hypothetical protein
MAITERDLKKLWGLSSGRCAFPGCNYDCLPFLDETDPTVTGEMAHVIAKSPTGPRGNGIGGNDTYENLVLLCPTHHTLVDKAPEGKYSEDILHEWKAKHEESVACALASPVFDDRDDMFRYLADLLAENHACWSTYGPESNSAESNPAGNLHRLWEFRKLSIIVPNNSRIVFALKRHKTLFNENEYRTAAGFIEHAAGFEKNCYERFDDVPRFPREFEALVNG